MLGMKFQNTFPQASPLQPLIVECYLPTTPESLGCFFHASDVVFISLQGYSSRRRNRRSVNEQKLRVSIEFEQELHV